jgi:RNA polymerase sigma-70 factor (ECF subfamily)
MAALTTLADEIIRLEAELSDDQMSVLAAQAGDPSGFAELYARYLPKLVGRARCKWRLSKEIAEDVVHDAWVRALEHVDSFDTSRPFEPWVFRILDNVVIDYLRRSRTGDGHKRQLPATEAELAEGMPAPAVTDVDRLADREALSNAMAALPARQQQTAVGVLVSGLTLSEAAAQLQLSNTACRQLLHRARLSLRRTLIEQGALPAFLPVLWLRRRFLALAQRLGWNEGTALAGSGTTLAAVVLTVAVATAGLDVAIASPRIERDHRAVVEFDRETLVAAATRDHRGMTVHGARDGVADRAKDSLGADDGRRSPHSRKAAPVVAVPQARVPLTGSRVHQEAPSDPDYEYGAHVATDNASVHTGFKVKHDQTGVIDDAGPADQVACDAAAAGMVTYCRAPSTEN